MQRLVFAMLLFVPVVLIKAGPEIVDSLRHINIPGISIKSRLPDNWHLYTDAQKLKYLRDLDYREEVRATHRVLLSHPQDEDGFNGVFGRTPSAGEMAEASKGIELIRRFQDISDAPGRDQMLSLIADSTENFLTIVGHNEEGVMQFADGTEASISELTIACKREEKKCIFMSCESAKYIPHGEDSVGGINSVVSFYDVGLVLEALSKKTGRRESYRSMEWFLREDAGTSSALAVASRRITNASQSTFFVGGTIGGIVFWPQGDRN